MPIINVTLPSDDTTADVGDYNAVILAMLAVINGLLDDNNIVSLSGTKITAGTLPDTALTAAAKKGWLTGLPVPNTVTYNGNRLYDLVFNSTDLTDEVSVGNRMQFTRTVASPTRCTSLNGTTQYFSKTAPAGMAETDDFVRGGWVKWNGYGVQAISSRYNGTSGWQLYVNASGQIILQGNNAGSANYSRVVSYQSVPLNKWVHVAAQLDMSAFTATSTTSYVMIDGVDVPAFVERAGTNPTALVQAGDLQIGASNGASFHNGKIAQAFATSAKVTQANIRTLYSQGLTSALVTANSIISAYSFDNAITDLNTTSANNLTANGGAVATNADSPFGGQASGSVSSTLDYAEVVSGTFAVNTTFTVRVPEGNTIPTSGGVSAVAYSSQDSPYGFPGISNTLSDVHSGVGQTAIGAAPVIVQGLVTTVNVPTGNKKLRIEANIPLVSDSTIATVTLYLYNGTTVGGTLLKSEAYLVAIAGAGNKMNIDFEYTPLPGSQSYCLGISTDTGTANTSTLGATRQASLNVKTV